MVEIIWKCRIIRISIASKTHMSVAVQMLPDKGEYEFLVPLIYRHRPRIGEEIELTLKI